FLVEILEKGRELPDLRLDCLGARGGDRDAPFGCEDALLALGFCAMKPSVRLAMSLDDGVECVGQLVGGEDVREVDGVEPNAVAIGDRLAKERLDPLVEQLSFPTNQRVRAGLAREVEADREASAVVARDLTAAEIRDLVPEQASEEARDVIERPF